MSLNCCFYLLLAAAVFSTFFDHVEARHRKKQQSTKPSDSNNDQNDDVQWDYLLFVQQWAPSVCNALPTDSCALPPKTHDWSIHGLWPNNNDGKNPESCDRNDKFDASKINSYRSQLEQGWPTLQRGRGKTQESFWAHEWDKHGTCAKSLPALRDEQKYFSQSLSLLKNFHVGEALAAKNIVPSNTKSYTKAQIQQALRDGVGQGRADIQLVCRRGRPPGTRPDSYAAAVSGAGKVAELVEARMCIDKQLNIINCPGFDNGGGFNSCPRTGIYLPNFRR